MRGNPHRAPSTARLRVLHRTQEGLQLMLSQVHLLWGLGEVTAEAVFAVLIKEVKTRVAGHERSAERRPNSLRIVSSTGSIMPARFARITTSHNGSNFFHPAAYAKWRRPETTWPCLAAPRAIDPHR